MSCLISWRAILIYPADWFYFFVNTTWFFPNWSWHIIYIWQVLTPQLLICSSFSREICHLLLITKHQPDIIDPITCWWCQCHLQKILVKIGIFPQVGVKIKSVWNNHPDFVCCYKTDPPQQKLHFFLGVDDSWYAWQGANPRRCAYNYSSHWIWIIERRTLEHHFQAWYIWFHRQEQKRQDIPNKQSFHKALLRDIHWFFIRPDHNKAGYFLGSWAPLDSDENKRPAKTHDTWSM